MAQHYVQLDDKNYVAKSIFKLQDSDDPTKWIQITVPTAKEIDFNNQFDKYYVDPDTKAVSKEHDTTTLGDLKTQLATAMDTITSQEKVINTQKDAITGLQQSLGEATQSQVAAQKDFDTKTSEFQSTFGDLTKQVVALQAEIDKLTATK